LRNVLFGVLVSFFAFSTNSSAQSYNYDYDRYDRSPSYGCQAELIARNGSIISIFDGYDCVDARRRCEDELYYRQRRGQNPQAQCRLVRSAPIPAPRPVPVPAPRPDYVEVERVQFRDSKTAVAIRNCKAARAVDARCTRLKDYQCGACSEIEHSDSSTYIVYQLINHRPYPTPTVQREFVQTFHFNHKETATARKKCEQYRSSLPQCSDPRYFECTPCTVESHTDHSQFELYRLIRY
jgi:hypothetical protein